MALSLDDIKKHTAKKKSSQKTDEPIQLKSQVKTKPWEKVSKNEPNTQEQINQEAKILVENISNWSRKIKLYPKINIPIPDFLLSKETD